MLLRLSSFNQLLWAPSPEQKFQPKLPHTLTKAPSNMADPNHLPVGAGRTTDRRQKSLPDCRRVSTRPGATPQRRMLTFRFELTYRPTQNPTPNPISNVAIHPFPNAYQEPPPSPCPAPGLLFLTLQSRQSVRGDGRPGSHRAGRPLFPPTGPRELGKLVPAEGRNTGRVRCDVRRLDAWFLHIGTHFAGILDGSAACPDAA